MPLQGLGIDNVHLRLYVLVKAAGTRRGLINTWRERCGCGHRGKVDRPFHCRDRATAGARSLQIDFDPNTGDPEADSLCAVCARVAVDPPWVLGL